MNEDSSPLRSDLIARATAGEKGLRRRVVIGMALAPMLAAGPSLAAVTVRAEPALARGVNLTHWFEYERGQSVTPREMNDLRTAGFDHVRIPVDPAVFGWTPQRDAAVTFLKPLRAAIDAALQADLAVVVDMHPTGETKQLIEDEFARETALIGLWTTIAAALADTPHDRVALELLNEPQYYGMASTRWPGFQKRLLAAVRPAMPRHLVLLTGARGSSAEGLAMLDPVADPRVAYTFHFYLPYLFTHQGADWMDTRWTTAGLHSDVRYPASAQRGRTPVLSQPHPSAAREMASYLGDDWRAERIAQAMQHALAWAGKHGKRVLCNEFGVIRAGVQPASRYRWIADVRSVLDANGIGWTVWDYTDIFGITAQSASLQSQGARTVDAEALQALGLKAS
ncbi:cellulase family glycosylhydrolase [soil metagenome]